MNGGIAGKTPENPRCSRCKNLGLNSDVYQDYISILIPPIIVRPKAQTRPSEQTMRITCGSEGCDISESSGGFSR